MLNSLCPFTAQLHTKDDTSREEAAAASHNLAHQCSDADAVEELAKHFFKVLNGEILYMS